MANEYVKNPLNHVEERFSLQEVQVTNINHNVNILMSAMSKNLGLFGKYVGSNTEDRSGD